MRWSDYLEVPVERGAILADKSVLAKLGISCYRERVKTFLSSRKAGR